jgi:hypothetical protein
MLVQIFSGFVWSGVSSAPVTSSMTPSRRKSGFVALPILMSSMGSHCFWVLFWAAFLLRGCRRFSVIACSVCLSFPASAGYFFIWCSRAVSGRSEQPTRFPSRSFFSASSAFARSSDQCRTDRSSSTRLFRFDEGARSAKIAYIFPANCIANSKTQIAPRSD